MSGFNVRRTRRDFLRDSAMFGAAATFGTGLLAACGVGSSTSSGGIAASGKPTRANTLNIGGWQWGPPKNFSPVGSNSDWPNGAGAGHLYIYETLFAWSLLDGGLKPALAKSVTYPDQLNAVVSLYQEAHWQDNKPVTADDVVYTFELAKRHTDLNYANFWTWVTAVTKVDDHTVQFTMSKDNLNPGQLKRQLAYTPILPQHIWTGIESKGGSLLNYVDTSPVGSGPFKLLDFNPQQVRLVRDDGWWGTKIFGKIAPAYIVHPVLKSNDDANLAFQNGDLDYSQTFAPQIWQMWEQKHLPVSTWFRQAPYYPPGNIPMIFLNLQKKGLSNPLVRQAIAYAIDYAKIAETAMSRYSIPVNSSLIIPDGAEKPLFDMASVQQNGWKFDAAKATQILEQQLGAKKGSDGVYVLPDGTRLGPWKAQCPYGWTDWMTSLQVVSDSAKSVGIDIQTNFPEQPQDISALQNGDFDIAMYSATGAGPASPWARFHDVLEIQGVPALGQTAFWNYNRYSNPAASALLTQAAAASAADQPGLFHQLDQIFMKDVPVIPLEYRPLEFFQTNAKYWTGWPTSDNPFAPPMWTGAGVRMLSKIRQKG